MTRKCRGRVPGTTVVRSTHARSTPPTAAMQSTLNSLLTTHDSITTSLSTLRTAASIHATRSSAVAGRLAAAAAVWTAAKDTGKMVRLKQRFLSELDNAKSLLGGGETALRRVIAILEGVAGATVNPSHPALSELAEASTALADALDREWRAWLGSSSGAELLWQGARSLALAPPGGLSDGLDNLGRQRSSLELARSLWETAERIDKLLSRLPEESGDSGEPTNVASCHALLQKECAQRCTADLQTANRLAAHATTIGTDDADGSSVLLEAVAEAASAAAKAARAASAVFTLLPPPEEVEDSRPRPRFRRCRRRRTDCSQSSNSCQRREREEEAAAREGRSSKRSAVRRARCCGDSSMRRPTSRARRSTQRDGER